MNIKILGATAAACLFALSLAAPVLAHENSFQKAGKAIQYTTRKDAENLSQTTHQAIGHNSIHKNRTGINAHTRYVLTPSGAKYRIYHHHHHHYHTHK
jgi:hypothetical protein